MSDRAQKIKELLLHAVNEFHVNSSRTKQARSGILGPSDIGFCRQKAALVTKQTQPTDSPPTLWSAYVGTAIHAALEAAIKAAYPDWLCGSIDNITTTATLPSGAKISGHPDLVVPSANAVLDIKTVDGFEWIRRSGTSQSHKYQRHLYALGLIQDGILDDTKPITKPVLVGNLYFDRSGKEAEPLVLVEDMDPLLTNEIDSWVTDVTYAVTHGEDASRDVAPAVCEKICEFFTVCRGSLEVRDGQERITDPDLVNAIDMYVDGRDMEKRGLAMKKQAAAMLSGINGSTEQYQIRWVHVNATTVPSSERSAYDRLDIVRARR